MICAYGNISATDENDFLLAQWYIRHCIAKYSANVSHPPSLHAVWKTVSCDEVAEHSLKRFGSLPFIGGGCYLRLVASVKLRFGTDKRHDI